MVITFLILGFLWVSIMDLSVTHLLCQNKLLKIRMTNLENKLLENENENDD
jgi:hypothetical protein